MSTHFTIESFKLSESAVLVEPAGTASALRQDVLRGTYGKVEGHLLGLHAVATPEDLHSDLWEMHPCGDEMLAMISGEVLVECAADARRSSCILRTGSGMILPAGVWHRLVLQRPGLLLALTPPHATQRADEPGCEA